MVFTLFMFIFVWLSFLLYFQFPIIIVSIIVTIYFLAFSFLTHFWDEIHLFSKRCKQFWTALTFLSLFYNDSWWLIHIFVIFHNNFLNLLDIWILMIFLLISLNFSLAFLHSLFEFFNLPDFRCRCTFVDFWFVIGIIFMILIGVRITILWFLWLERVGIDDDFFNCQYVHCCLCLSFRKT